MRFPLGEMSVGDVLDRGLKILFARLPVFYAINLLVLSPLIVVQIVAPIALLDGPGAVDIGAAMGILAVTLLAVLIAVMLQPIATAAILHIVMEDYADRRTSMGAALSFALSRFFPLLLASILVGLLVGVGLLLCCVPGIYFWITFAFVGQVVVLERLGVGESFQRSQTLVSGHFWRVLGVLLLILIAMRVVEWALAAGLGQILPAQKPIPVQGGVRIEMNAGNHIVTTLIVQLVNILFASYLAVCTTLLYLDLRIRKEGFDLELAAGGEGGRSRDRDDEDRYDDDDRDDRYDDDRPRGGGGREDRPWDRERDNDRYDDDDRGRDRR